MNMHCRSLWCSMGQAPRYIHCSQYTYSRLHDSEIWATTVHTVPMHGNVLECTHVIPVVLLPARGPCSGIRQIYRRKFTACAAAATLQVCNVWYGIFFRIQNSEFRRSASICRRFPAGASGRSPAGRRRPGVNAMSSARRSPCAVPGPGRNN